MNTSTTRTQTCHLPGEWAVWVFILGDMLIEVSWQ